MATSERGHAYTLAEVAAFLDGGAPLDGVWFDEYHLTETGAYWWRKYLRAALSAAEARAERYRVALDGLTSVVGLTAFKHEGQRAVLQEAFDAARAALTEGERDG